MNAKLYPAAAAYVLNLAMSAIVAFGGLSASQAHIVSTAVVAATSLLVVALARPLAVPAFTGAFQTFVVALGGFGFHLPDDQLAKLVAVVGFAAAAVAHYLGWSKAAWQAGKTTAELQGGPAPAPPAA